MEHTLSDRKNTELPVTFMIVHVALIFFNVYADVHVDLCDFPAVVHQRRGRRIDRDGERRRPF